MSDERKRDNELRPEPERVKLRKVGGSVVATQPDNLLAIVARSIRGGVRDLINTEVEISVETEEGHKIPYLVLRFVELEEEEGQA